MELNVEKIKVELKRIGKNQSWLAKEMGVARQYLSYIFKHKPITQAERIAKALNLDPKDLIKWKSAF